MRYFMGVENVYSKMYMKKERGIFIHVSILKPVF